METLIVEREGGVVTLTLNRPEKKNAANTRMWRELAEVFEEVATRRDDRVLLVTGAGDGFCSGADLTDAEGGTVVTEGVGAGLASMRVVNRAARLLHELPKPAVAAVNGVAAGAGLNLALGCDLVVASDRARFSEIFARRGLVVDFGGSWLLPRRIGLHRAKELVLLADIIDATEAERIGLVNRVVEHDRLLDEARALASRLAALPPVTLSASKRLLDQSFSLTLPEALEAEAYAQSLMFRSADTHEAVAAFIQKRDPHFKGE